MAIWIDLGPHLLAAVQALKVNATPDFSSLSYELSDLSFAVSFNLNCGSDLLPCKLKVSRTVADPAHIRRLTFNDEVVDLEGCRDEDGIYRASYVLGGKSFVEADPLDRLISRMLHEDPVLPAERARENLQWLLAIAEQMP